jgi:hypothetical protein
MRKGRLRKGPGKKCRRSGIRKPGRTLGNRMEYRGLKKRRTKVNAVRGTPKGGTGEKRRRTRPEFNNGIRDKGARQHIILEKKTHNEAIRKSLQREIAKLIFESSIRLRRPSDWTLWKCRPPPKRKR